MLYRRNSLTEPGVMIWNLLRSHEVESFMPGVEMFSKICSEQSKFLTLTVACPEAMNAILFYDYHFMVTILW